MNSDKDIIKLDTSKLITYGAISVSLGVGLGYLISRIKGEDKKDINNEKLSAKLSKDISPQKNNVEIDQSYLEFAERKRNYFRKHTKILEQEANEYRIQLELKLGSENSLLAEIKFLESDACGIQKIPHLAATLQLRGEFPSIVTPLIGDSKYRSVYGGEGFLPEEAFVPENSYVLSRASFDPKHSLTETKRFLRAGPRKFIFFRPTDVRACIVTCGGLCPGLNVVVREVFNTLYYNYKVKKIYGIRYGFKGFYAYEWIEMKPDHVKRIHNWGGTILGSSRGGFDAEKIIQSLIDNEINQIYCIGGDGTHRGILRLFQEITARNLKITVVGIPKTIDNDIAIIDKSFGFETAVEEAQRAIQSADIEANSQEFGVGLVKLMGRQAGFIAMYAALASRDVNICLIPEFPFELEGPRGLLAFISRRLRIKNHAVIVVAEGAATSIMDAKLDILGHDESGNPKLADVGVFLKSKITEYLKKTGVDCTLKYIDPTYMIRTVQANSYDKQICSQLAQNAVHGAMSGWTGFTVGNVNNRTCWIPILEIAHPPQPIQVRPDDRAWQRLLASTGQPSFINLEEDLMLEERRASEGEKKIRPNEEEEMKFPTNEQTQEVFH